MADGILTQDEDNHQLVLENVSGAQEAHVTPQQATRDRLTIDTLLAPLATHQGNARLRNLPATLPASISQHPNGVNCCFRFGHVKPPYR